MTVIPFAWSHEPTFDVNSTDDILKFCEFYYEDYLLLGSYELSRHSHYPNIRGCEILYNNVAWSSDHWGREKVLISEIEKYLGSSDYLKDRHIEFSKIPNWMKTDAQRWVDGGKIEGFAHVVRTILESELIIMPLENSQNDICIYEKLCLKQGDYVEFLTIHDKEKISKKYTISKVTENELKVYLKTVFYTDNSIKKTLVQQFTSTIDSGFTEFSENNECCMTFDFMIPYPIEVGSDIVENDLKVIRNSVIPFNDGMRNVFVAQDSSGKTIQTIDKDSGLILSSTVVSNNGVTEIKETFLTDTNIFEKDSNAFFDELYIPVWFKQNTEWYLDGTISEADYVASLKYLLSSDLLKV